MSIDIDRFDERSPEELAEMSNPEQVLKFLYENRDRAWKAAEIARQTDVNANSIHPVLARLEDQKLVRHKGPYWAITDEMERLRNAYDVHRATRLFDDLYGEEDRDEWIEASEQASE
ncbi:helix-turn-helix domain-containing protein [Natrononativus amylolyticus]|uniref:helix-turn-helix domain-containing protein n=1 Tax=Natrononativus amylolyticus TaxID=2963434 RepID=UPI0020CDB982|nr:helix-turn-helix domain-containing protein [Natrononativus amylolyticus]